MGRTAGATAAGTRERLLRCAADVFAARGYEGTRVADIAAAGGLAGLVRQAQDRGELDPALSPDAVAHFCLSLAAGTALVGPDLENVDDPEWTALLGRLVGALAPTPAGRQMGTDG